MQIAIIGTAYVFTEVKNINEKYLIDKHIKK